MTALSTTMAKMAPASIQSPRAMEMTVAARRMRTKKLLSWTRTRFQKGVGGTSGMALRPYFFRRAWVSSEERPDF